MAGKEIEHVHTCCPTVPDTPSEEEKTRLRLQTFDHGWTGRVDKTDLVNAGFRYTGTLFIHHSRVSLVRLVRLVRLVSLVRLVRLVRLVSLVRLVRLVRLACERHNHLV